MKTLFLAACLVAGCQHRPVEELILAGVAVKAAQRVKADALAPDLIRKAENNYIRAKRDYEEGYFESCRKFAIEARLLAEKAEYQSISRQSRVREGPETEARDMEK